MRNQPISLGTVTISTSAQASSAIDLDRKYIRSLVIGAPAAVTGTINVQISLDKQESWLYLQSGSTDIDIPAARCVVIDCVGYDAVRVYSSSAEAVDRIFTVKAVEEF